MNTEYQRHKNSRKFKKIARMPSAWQLNPDRITTDHVQFWSNGVMVISGMTNADARRAVREGRAFVISDQAIGRLENGEMRS